MDEDKRKRVEARRLEMMLPTIIADLEARALLLTIYFGKTDPPRRTVEGYIKGGADEVENVAHLKTYRRYRTMEAAANRLQKESKGYLDSLRGKFVLVDLPEQR